VYLLAEGAPVAEDGLYALRLIGEGEYDLADAGAGEQVQLVLKQRPIRDGGGRLGQPQRERTQPRALAAGQDHGLHGVTMGGDDNTHVRIER
jgi:hypothetical protein